MNPKHVLSKIMAVLSAKEEVLFTYARLADGAIVESPTFDLGETVEVVTEEGKTPAPDGYHDLELKDESGNEVYIRVKTEGGVITERENVEEAKPEAEAEFESVAGEDIGGGEGEAQEQTDTTEPLTEDTDMSKMIEKLQYRIEEMEKKMQLMEEMFPAPTGEETITDGKGAEETKEIKPEMMAAVEPEEEEEELPKLDGAPVEEKAPFKAKQNFGKKIMTPQSTFLSKLYN
jgi:hypothetical protein